MIEDLELPTKACFVHIPLDTSQVMSLDDPQPFMPKAMVAEALAQLIEMASTDLHEAVDQLV